MFRLLLIAIVLVGCSSPYIEAPDVFWKIVAHWREAHGQLFAGRDTTITPREVIARRTESVLRERLPASAFALETFMVENGFLCYVDDKAVDLCVYQREIPRVEKFGPYSALERAVIVVKLDLAGEDVAGVTARARYEVVAIDKPVTSSASRSGILLWQQGRPPESIMELFE